MIGTSSAPSVAAIKEAASSSRRAGTVPIGPRVSHRSPMADVTSPVPARRDVPSLLRSAIYANGVVSSSPRLAGHRSVYLGNWMEFEPYPEGAITLVPINPARMV